MGATLRSPFPYPYGWTSGPRWIVNSLVYEPFSLLLSLLKKDPSPLVSFGLWKIPEPPREFFTIFSYDLDALSSLDSLYVGIPGYRGMPPSARFEEEWSIFLYHSDSQTVKCYQRFDLSGALLVYREGRGFIGFWSPVFYISESFPPRGVPEGTHTFSFFSLFYASFSYGEDGGIVFASEHDPWDLERFFWSLSSFPYLVEVSREWGMRHVAIYSLPPPFKEHAMFLGDGRQMRHLVKRLRERLGPKELWPSPTPLHYSFLSSFYSDVSLGGLPISLDDGPSLFWSTLLSIQEATGHIRAFPRPNLRFLLDVYCPAKRLCLNPSFYVLGTGKREFLISRWQEGNRNPYLAVVHGLVSLGREIHLNLVWEPEELGQVPLSVGSAIVYTRV